MSTAKGSLFEKLNGRKAKDLRVLRDFVAIYCRENHGDAPKDAFPIRDERVLECLGDKPLALCRDCGRLLSHGIAKLVQCPYDPKPMCKKCPTHCYAPGYREKVRQVMRFSGMYLVRHGRLDLVRHYFF